MIDFPRNKKTPRQISVVPLIDVGFFLLIFFLIAGSIQKFEILQVEIPYADSGRLIEEGPVIIVLGRHEEILVNDELVLADDFFPLMQTLMQRNPDRIITLKVDSRLPATRMIALMNRIKAAGGRNVSLVTQKL